MKKKKEETVEQEVRKTQDMSVVAEYTGEKSNRAKLVEYEGDDYDDTPVKDNSLAGRTENFWYHYKWHVIFGVIILFVALVGIRQLIERGNDKTDLSIMYAGPYNLNSLAAEEVKDTFAEILSEDLDGNGKKSVYLYTFYVLSDQQIAQAKAEEAGGTDRGLDLSQNRKNYSSFTDAVFTGECGVMFLDGWLYETVKESGGLVTFDDALGYTPEKAFDEYGIRLCDTNAYEKYPALAVLPAETVVCVRSVSTAGGVIISEKEAKENYEAGVHFISDFLADD